MTERIPLLFLRRDRGPSGGEWKARDLFLHARSSRRFTPLLHLAEEPADPALRTWTGIGPRTDRWEPEAAGGLFFGGIDWPDDAADPGRPVFTLIQGLGQADPADPRHRFLVRPATRICVSTVVADTLHATGRVNGPIHVLPLALPSGALPDATGARTIPILVAGMKDPGLGRAVAAGLRRAGLAATLVVEPLLRPDYLTLIARAGIAVPIPAAREGFFLPALEAMALGTLVVCPDAGGNREIVRDGETGFLPARTPEAIVDAVVRAVELPARQRAAMRAAGRAEASARTEERERVALCAILDGEAVPRWT